MENDLNSKNVMVIVMGLPGSGKSYFAAILADEISAIHLQSDKIREQMNLKGNYADDTKMLVYRELCDQARKLLEKHKSVIVDATFYLDLYRKLFYQMADKLNVQVITLLIESGEDIVKQRLNKQRRFSEADYSTYLSIKRDFDPVLHPFINLESTDSNLDSMLHQAINYLMIGNDR